MEVTSSHCGPSTPQSKSSRVTLMEGITGGSACAVEVTGETQLGLRTGIQSDQAAHLYKFCEKTLRGDKLSELARLEGTWRLTAEAYRLHNGLSHG